MSKQVLNIAVTGLNAIDSPGSGISVIRALRDAESFDVRIIGLSYESLEPGIYMHEYVDKTYQIPFPSAGQEALLARLEYIHSVEKLDFIIPNFDAELFNFIKIAEQLREKYGIHSCLPTVEQFEARQKVNLNEYGRKHNLKIPFAETLHSANEIDDLGSRIEYPCVVKGQYYESSIAYNSDQAKSHFQKIAGKWGTPILIQEFIYGSEVNVCGVGDGEGGTIGAVPMRKLFITDQGKAWAGITIEDEELLRITAEWLKTSKWNGGFELEFMKTTEDEYYLLEINPRFPAWVYLTVGAGQNQVEASVHLGMGNTPERFDSYESGKMFIRYSYDMIVNLNEFEQISTFGEL